MRPRDTVHRSVGVRDSRERTGRGRRTGRASPRWRGLEVTDHGFSQFDGRSNVSLGAVVRNTSGRIAYRTEVSLRVVDAQGRDAVHPSHARWLIQQIPVIRPGEQVALGATVATREVVGGAADKVSSFDVAFGSVTWLPADTAASFPPFAATVHDIERSKEERLTGSVRYSVTSTACRPMTPRGTAAVFFDSSGAVVGGLLDAVHEPSQCGTAGYDARTLDSDIPLRADQAKTLVSEYCDLSRLAGGVYRPSGEPVN
ncbi:hypothetical protein Aiant_50730 [Actinoplanes ianthinogenes]|uniref:Uncharacterized protein n=1 Tax=Actinoplanes ianthinogenes TaxID=122358 RepID=A0ABN6CFW6_9ACTN|nr:hypothetical protein [Actinoplanes ianthinogenes]BCJ44416.1 hypothetical protein Aiant_50730 [Actinoplanes ianthinogenes]